MIMSSGLFRSSRALTSVIPSRPCCPSSSSAIRVLVFVIESDHPITHRVLFRPLRLFDIVHADQKLYLVFEFLDVDLKRYMENGNKSGRPITPAIVKVCPLLVMLVSHSDAVPRDVIAFYACLTREGVLCRVATRPQDCHRETDMNITRVT